MLCTTTSEMQKAEASIGNNTHISKADY